MRRKKKFLFFYERLSREDGDDESCSITNQRRLLNRFKEEHSEFHDYQVEEFIDDGYTGSNFNRPNFQNMMSRVRSLYGNMIVIATKDCCAIMGLNQKDLENQGILA